MVQWSARVARQTLSEPVDSSSHLSARISPEHALALTPPNATRWHWRNGYDSIPTYICCGNVLTSCSDLGKQRTMDRDRVGFAQYEYDTLYPKRKKSFNYSTKKGLDDDVLNA